MIEQYRTEFNRNFSANKYHNLLENIVEGYPKITFRVAESPIFIPKKLMEQLQNAGEEIIKTIKREDFKTLTANAIPQLWRVPNENNHPHFLTFDFALCKNEAGEIVPKLIELQGFPSLYGFQAHLANQYQTAYNIDTSLSPFFGNLDETQYFELLKKVIVGKHSPEEIVLVDVDAIQQKTAIDFLITAKKLGIKVLSWQDLIKKDKSLFYLENGEHIKIKRLYNRLIFDEIADRKNFFDANFDPREEIDIEWITHPNWFYRISKYTMPFLDSEFVPETKFLHQIEILPTDLENYVLKPLFSFAGAGVMIDVTAKDISAIKDPENWILQKKVVYEPVVKSPDGGVKVEIRLMYLWPDGEEPQLCINLARFSKGKMIGVNYNADFDWVGGTIGLMNKNFQS